MKIYKSIIDLEFSVDLEFSMSFANLFIGLLVQRFLVFSSKAAISDCTKILLLQFTDQIANSRANRGK